MKNLILILFLLVVVLNGFGQDTLVIKTTNDNYQRGSNKFEEFTITKGDSIKHGSYVRYSEFGLSIQKGRYAKGIRVGIWEYYTNDVYGSLIGKFDWDTFNEVVLKSNNNKSWKWELAHNVITSVLEDGFKKYKISKEETVYILFNLIPSGELAYDRYGSIKTGLAKENVSIENQVIFDAIISTFPKLFFQNTFTIKMPVQIPVKTIIKK